MNYWLLKSEPSVFSIDALAAAPRKTTHWEGVRNFQVRNMLRDDFKKGDLGFFYHSGEEKAVVGIVEVIGEYRPDPTDAKGQFGLVVVKAVKDMPKPFTLTMAKTTPALAEMSLVKSFRLSVQPVTAAEWKLVCAKGGL